MIWLWIIAAIILSLLPLINKKIDLPYYIWILLPIDAYGIVIANATIKPYMIFAVILPVVFYAQNKGKDYHLSASKGQLFLGIISCLIILVNLINNNDFSSVKAAIMTLVVYVCAQCTASTTDLKKSDQFNDVFIASCFGYSLVFIIAYICLINDINIGGIVAQTREEAGMFMQLKTMSNGKLVQTYRLRGFIYDPNTMFTPLILGICACISKLFKKFNLYHLLTIAMAVFCIIISSSRMGLICCVVAILITSAVSISQLEDMKNKILSFVTVLAGGITLLCVFMSNWGQNILSSLLSTYTNRSSLNDEYGRFSIWRNCLEIYWDNNPLFGVGFSQMPNYTTTNRMTHNTWLQFICECGIIVGSIAIIYFISILLIGWINSIRYNKKAKNNTAFLVIAIGYTMVCLSLVSVDHITYSYLWILALLILKMSNYMKNTQNTSLSDNSGY